MTDKDFYSIVEFAVKLDAHPNTIRRAIKSGHIAAFKLGIGKKSSYRIAHSELQRMAMFNLEDVIKDLKKE
jgi:excisionase family DNA binding protein